jgi:hypothetical protein
VPAQLVAVVMAFGSGVLISALAFEKAALHSGLIATLGFLAAFSLHSLG